MRHYVEQEDRIVYHWPKQREYLIPVHDGGASGIVMRFCPWCGTRLPDSRRDDADEADTPPAPTAELARTRRRTPRR